MHTSDYSVRGVQHKAVSKRVRDKPLLQDFTAGWGNFSTCETHSVFDTRGRRKKGEANRINMPEELKMQGSRGHTFLVISELCLLVKEDPPDGSRSLQKQYLSHSATAFRLGHTALYFCYWNKYTVVRFKCV